MEIALPVVWIGGWFQRQNFLICWKAVRTRLALATFSVALLSVQSVEILLLSVVSAILKIYKYNILRIVIFNVWYSKLWHWSTIHVCFIGFWCLETKNLSVSLSVSWIPHSPWKTGSRDNFTVRWVLGLLQCYKNNRLNPLLTRRVSAKTLWEWFAPSPVAGTRLIVIVV